MSWIDVKNEKDLPDIGESVLTKCPKMGHNGQTIILVSKYIGNNEWYSFFPFDQPVLPTHWCYSMNLID